MDIKLILIWKKKMVILTHRRFEKISELGDDL
jgi:hypothetical protein